jgi:hypothetical protein
MFYDKKLQVYTMTEGYKDEDNIWIEGKLEYLKAIVADVQPYSQDLLKKQYGFDIEVTKRVFCDLDLNIVIGSVFKLDANNIWEVRKIIQWDDYMELMCLDTDVFNK